MPVYRLSDRPVFPDPELAEPEGLIAVGGDLSSERLLNGYRQGIFPWYSDGDPLLWWSPDPRVVLDPGELHVPRSLAKLRRKRPYELSFDRCFEEVVRGCSRTPRPGQDGTWITDEMCRAYVRLHELGFAHSVEAMEEGQLVGGLYGVALGGVFFGESMFSLAADASKLAFVALCERLVDWGFELVDCQLHTEHLARFGAREQARSDFLRDLHGALALEGKPGSWSGESPQGGQPS